MSSPQCHQHIDGSRNRWQKSVHTSSSKLYKNGLKSEPCGRTLYPVRVIHSAPQTQKTSVLHHSRHSLFLQLKWRWNISHQQRQTILLTSFFSKTILSRRQYAILFCSKVQTYNTLYISFSPWTSCHKQANLLDYTSPITKDPCQASQLTWLLPDTISVEPLPSPECHYKYQANTSWPPSAMPVQSRWTNLRQIEHRCKKIWRNSWNKTRRRRILHCKDE
jgi:hypothetical protein